MYHYFGKHLLLILLLLPILALGQDAELDNTDVQSTVKASYLFNFAKYSDWPSEWKSGAFVIGVAGSPGVLKELREKYNNKPIGSQLLEIREISGKEPLPKKLHVVFVGRNYGDYSVLVKNFKNAPVLIVAEQEGALETGSLINFKSMDGVLKFEVNDSRARQAGIKIGDLLKGWAVTLK
jgi:hypothetical protein